MTFPYPPEPAATVANPFIKSSTLLSDAWSQLTTLSGGPPENGASPQANRDGTWQWSSVAGYFLSSEAGIELISESGSTLISERTT